jgi:hypothetical protein
LSFVLATTFFVLVAIVILLELDSMIKLSVLEYGLSILNERLNIASRPVMVPVVIFVASIFLIFALVICADKKKKINVDYLPKSGGTIDNSNVDVLGLNCTSGTMSTLRFYGSGKRLGNIGFNAQNSSLYRWNTSDTAYRILDKNDLPLMTNSRWVNITLDNEITAINYIGARVRKIGNIVNIIMGVTGATAAFQTLGTLTQGYRPSKEINLAARYYNSPTAAISIGTDGTIKLLQTASGGSSYNANKAISFSITYFI